jgi:hypothetical protein
VAVIVDKLNSIFFLSPGTGSTSLSKFFIDHFDAKWAIEGSNGKHATPREVSSAGFDLKRYLCITTTRNPFDFYISQYYKKRTWEGDHETLAFAKTHEFGEFLRYTLQNTPQGLLHPIFLRPADIVFRKERLADDLAAFLRLMGRESQLELPKENVSINLDHKLVNWYLPEQIADVYDHHREHFERFGYEKTQLDPERPLTVGEDAKKKARRIGNFMLIRGRNDWLYLSDSSNHVVSHASGRYSAEEHWLESWRQTVAGRVSKLKMLGGRHGHFIVPNTHTAVPLNLPDEVTVAKERPLDRLVSGLEGLPFFDLTPMFCKYDPKECFIATDSHWSGYGAYLGYKAVCEALTLLSFDIPRSAFQWSEVAGDLGSKLTPQRSGSALTIAPETLENICGTPAVVLSNHVEITGKVRIFKAPSPLNKKRLLLVGDSYTYANLYLFATTFQETYFMHTRSINLRLVADLAPDLLICVGAERFILDAPKDSICKEYLAEYESKLLLDMNAGTRPQLPSFNGLGDNDLLTRVFPLFGDLEEIYDKLANRHGVTIKRIQELYRVLLRREPKPADILDKWMRHKELQSLIAEFVTSQEFQSKSGIRTRDY